MAVTRVLFVCTANVARSQMAEALLRATDPAGGKAATDLDFIEVMKQIRRRVELFVTISEKE
jgi:protein-tyrosine-phosphatase